MSSLTSHPTDPQSVLQILRNYEQLCPSRRAGAGRRPPSGATANARIHVAERSFAVRLSSIKALVRHPRLIPVPGTPSWIPGALRVGQNMLAVIDGGWASGQSDLERNRDRTLAVILDLVDTQVAVLVDAVDGFEQASDHETGSGIMDGELDLDELAQRIARQCSRNDGDSQHAPVPPCDGEREDGGSQGT